MLRPLQWSLYVLIFFGLFSVMNIVTAEKFHYLKERQNLFHNDIITARERQRQLDCLAINIYREAATEPFEGKVAVAQVTMNRTIHPAFPNDICEVVYQKNNFFGKTVCQFSWYCNSKHRVRPVSEQHYEESYEVAKKVLLENFRLSSLNQALYYHADYVNPKWKHVRLIKIGKHIFYRPRNNA
jgi:spore germination cell wall hydrolase CwlJ-like protein